MAHRPGSAAGEPFGVEPLLLRMEDRLKGWLADMLLKQEGLLSKHIVQVETLLQRSSSRACNTELGMAADESYPLATAGDMAGSTSEAALRPVSVAEPRVLRGELVAGFVVEEMPATSLAKLRGTWDTYSDGGNLPPSISTGDVGTDLEVDRRRPFFQALSTSSALGEDQAALMDFVGEWVDNSGSFYSGVTIVIAPGAWGPVNPPQEVHRSATYTVASASADKWVLVEGRTDGTERHFLLQRLPDDDGDVVQALLIKGINTQLQWVLSRCCAEPFPLLHGWPEITDVQQVGRLFTIHTKGRAGSVERPTIASGSYMPNSLSRGFTASALSDGLDKEGWNIWRLGSSIKEGRVNCMWNPNSRTRLAWDFTSCIFIACDVIMLPMGFFELPDTEGMRVFQIVALIFWCIDMCFSFLTGYVDREGEVQMRIRNVVRHYLRTFFLIDFSAVAIDWGEVFFEAKRTSNLPYSGALRALRIIRLLKLLRFFKVLTLLPRLLDSWGLMVQSESLELVVDLIKMMMIIIFCTHLSACFWYGVGKASAPDGHGWVFHSELEDASFAYRYFISFHWALAQIIGGESGIHADGVWERAFSVGILFVGFFISTSVVSSITSGLTQLLMLRTKYRKEREKLKHFLVHYNIDNEFSMQVLRNASLVAKRQQTALQEEDVEWLHLLPKPLHAELRFKIFWPSCGRHPFFKGCRWVCSPAVRTICLDISQHQQHGGEKVFNAGERATIPMMHVVFRGTLEYVHRASGRCQSVTPGHWAAEPAVWTMWEHQGDLLAPTACNLLTIKAEAMQAMVFQFPALMRYVGGYAQGFLKLLVNVPEEDLTDLHVERLMDLTSLTTELVDELLV